MVALPSIPKVYMRVVLDQCSCEISAFLVVLICFNFMEFQDMHCFSSGLRWILIHLEL